MAEIQRMPKSGYTMTEGRIISIKIEIGSLVQKGDVLMEYETEKLVGEVTSTVSGTVLEIYIDEGDTIEVQGKLCLIGEIGENSSVGETMSDPCDKPQTAQSDSRVIASPLARKIAAEAGLDLSTITGSGPGGRIEKKDVEVLSADNHELNYYLEGVLEPMSSIRKVIAKRMLISKQEIPHAYYRKEIDASSIQSVRKNFSGSEEKKYGIKLSVNDIVLKSVSRALVEFPLVNARMDEDSIFYYRHINIGLAVGVKDGLIVPVIHGAESKTVYEISREASELVKKAHEGLLKNDECSGGTFTVSNLGMFGIDEFCAVINPPEAAILAVGAIREKAVFKDGNCVPVQTMVLTLSADHRIVDGVLAAQFMKRLAEILENAFILLS